MAIAFCKPEPRNTSKHLDVHNSTYLEVPQTEVNISPQYDFCFLVHLYSNQGVLCRNIGQEHKSGYNRKYDMDPMICIRKR